MRRAIALASAVCAVVLSAAPPAEAITLSVTSAIKLAGNTADNSDTTSPVAQNLSSITVLDSGGTGTDSFGSSVNLRTRYTSVTTADSDAADFASITRAAVHSYRVTFSIDTIQPFTPYNVKIDTSRLGALVVRNEGNAAAQADISSVTGMLNGISLATLGLPDPGVLNTNSTTVIPINQSSTLTVFGIGDASFQLDFTWTSSAGSGSNIIDGGDEGAVLLGQPGTISQIGAADDYPGTSGRSPQSADGHFVNVTVTVLPIVPEPSTFALAAVGLAVSGLAACRRRRTAESMLFRCSTAFHRPRPASVGPRGKGVLAPTWK